MSRAALAALAAVALAACGGERELTATELVSEFNDRAVAGAELTLGESLLANEDAPGEVFTVELRIPGEFGGTGSGSLVVLADSDEGGAEFDRCESSASLVCYRAANAVLRFEDLDANGQSAVARTLQAVSDASR